MSGIKCILFDCMETLVDMSELPSLEDYAYWAFKGSGVEERWNGFDEFFGYYKAARGLLSEKYSDLREYEMTERYELLVRISFPGADPETVEQLAERISSNYWKEYKRRCYVSDDVKKTINELTGKYRLGVVSNFMVSGGIEELLEEGGIIKCFDLVVTSIAEGWRKPCDKIYFKALQGLGVCADETLFVGDDYVNDYIAPKKLGMKALLLDKYDRHTEVEERIYCLSGMEDVLKCI
jgi:putative hydrolase of the HAD superfamily